ncbi:MAG: hypothetical protein MUO35_08975, partial [Anaerolineales bacterium]|nr:hypothetical protein [Anaerolineales bacterium]
MQRSLLGLGAAVFIVVWLTACGAPPAATPTVPAVPGIPTATPPPTATTVAPPTIAAATGGFEAKPLPTGRNELFSGSGACAVCHTRMTDESGKDVSIDSAWRASIKAQAARDPYFLASVRAEVEAFPD